MAKIIVFGNSGSGKSTLAKKLAVQGQYAHLDLDSVAWLPNTRAPQRMPLTDSMNHLEAFTSGHSSWVIEGCYADLIELILPYADEVIYLNLTIKDCISNAQKRPWEPEKYASKQAQDANLQMLIAWITEYETRDDTFSKSSHMRLFESFQGTKKMITQNQP